MRWRRLLVGVGVLLVAGIAGTLAVFTWPSPIDPYTKFFKDDAPANTTVADGAMPFEFIDRNGEKVKLADYRGKAVVLVVVRGVATNVAGDFCSFCLAQTNALAQNYDQFQARGAEVVMVFPGSAEDAVLFTRKVKDRHDAPAEPTFPVLLDPELAAVDKLGIRGTKAKPSTYILDKDGRVVYAYVGAGMSDRPSVKAVLDQLDKLKGK